MQITRYSHIPLIMCRACSAHVLGRIDFQSFCLTLMLSPFEVLSPFQKGGIVMACWQATLLLYVCILTWTGKETSEIIGQGMSNHHHPKKSTGFCGYAQHKSACIYLQMHSLHTLAVMIGCFNDRAFVHFACIPLRFLPSKLAYVP